MDANLSISSSPALNGAASTASPGAVPAGAELRGGDFADLLRGLQADTGRQDFAAAGLAEAGLQTVALGPQLELITAASPVPDADSLMAFARTQGLDDGTLAMLFGGMPGPVTGQGAALLSGAAVPAAWTLGVGASAGIGIGNGAGIGIGAGTDGEATGLAGLAGLAGVPVKTASALLVSAQAGALGLSDMVWQVSKPVASLDAAAATAVPGSADTPDTLAEALRLQLQMPREAVSALTRRLAGLSGNAQPVVWGQLQAQALSDTREVTLDLREFFNAAGEVIEATDAADAPDVAAPLGSTSGVLHEGARSAAAGLTLQGDNPVLSQAGARLEHYQQLADRLGQALAQRLQAQIERGEWKLQMRMDPASLGRIDLELDMRAGGLDAVFRSDNPLTRELIAQSLPKLRDSLQQSGTTVAQVWVNGDSAGQAGGNPTPPGTPSAPAQESGTVRAAQAPAQPAASSPRASDSDWDVLA